ncbi:hypothetical protein FA95DRAFT_1555825 [Auriscalpium vulgare]|uniref:Uncharacterized protein n=1 Tax=Auriscalpium vulgare TaxID=40419 RepID=A0ACB8S2D8_9AGAM|nr:hypothetical protein FA95DRAFT_1555825 [Auriscalpium vulgare]
MLAITFNIDWPQGHYFSPGKTDACPSPLSLVCIQQPAATAATPNVKPNTPQAELDGEPCSCSADKLAGQASSSSMAAPHQCLPKQRGLACCSGPRAPTFDGDALSLYPFFHTFEKLADMRGLPEGERAACMLAYVPPRTRVQWTDPTLVGRSGDAPMSYADLKEQICMFHLGESRPRKYRERKLAALVADFKAASRAKADSERAAYLDAFMEIAGWLWQNGDLCEHSVSEYFRDGICGLREGERAQAVEEAQSRARNVFSESWLEASRPHRGMSTSRCHLC